MSFVTFQVRLIRILNLNEHFSSINLIMNGSNIKNT